MPVSKTDMPDSKTRPGAFRPNGHDPVAGHPAILRDAVNKANAQKSTGPRSDAGKQRSNAECLAPWIN
jgi:hypothetical protein